VSDTRVESEPHVVFLFPIGMAALSVRVDIGNDDQLAYLVFRVWESPNHRIVDIGVSEWKHLYYSSQRVRSLVPAAWGPQSRPGSTCIPEATYTKTRKGNELFSVSSTFLACTASASVC